MYPLKGTHPKTYTEKYKELKPLQYADDAAQVIQKGRTPADMHLPILLKEILDFSINITGADRTGCDAWLWRTFFRNA